VVRSRRHSIPRALSVGALVAATIGATELPAAATAAAAPPTVGTASGTVRVLGLGDSVLRTGGCGCPGMLKYYARLATNRLHRQVQSTNEAAGYATSDTVVAQMRQGRVRNEVRRASLVVIFVGANDFRAAFDRVARGAAADGQYAPVAEHLRRKVAQVLGAIHDLNQNALVVVCGYWNDFKDGAVAQHQYSEARRRAADDATRYTNDALYRAAIDAGVGFLSTRHGFDRYGDRTPLLADDGDHLSAAGHQFVARRLLDLVHPLTGSGDTGATPGAPGSGGSGDTYPNDGLDNSADGPPDVGSPAGG